MNSYTNVEDKRLTDLFNDNLKRLESNITLAQKYQLDDLIEVTKELVRRNKM